MDKRFSRMRGIGLLSGSTSKNGKRRRNHDDNKRITMDDVFVRPVEIRAKKKKNINTTNSGAGFMSSLGYSGENGFKATYKCPKRARKLEFYN